MLTEFALTPSIFDEEAHEDKDAWRDQLRELISSMFPRTAVVPVIVSDLFAGSWSSHVVPYVERIRDHRAKKYCQDLLTMMHNRLVIRPECREWPYDEDVAWCREAVASNMIVPIERIISVETTKNMLSGECDSIRSIEEVLDAGFWRGIASDASPRMIIADQIMLLRKLCLHSQWIALINPYTSTTETDFAIELLRMALNRPSGFEPVKIEFHAQEPQNCSGEEDLSERIRSVTNTMTWLVRRTLSASDAIDLYFWPRILERRLIAGTFSRDSNGQQHKCPRWGVSMNHVARGTDSDADSTNWSLLRNGDLDDWFRKYVKEDAPNKPAATTISHPAPPTSIS